MQKKGFTLVEIIVTLGILGMISVMVGSMAVYMSGRLRSRQNNNVNEALRHALSLISQKSYSANAKVNISGQKAYGFYKYTDAGKNVLIIIGSDNDETYCTYFGLRDDRIFMAQEPALAQNCSEKPLDELASPVTSSGVAIGIFDIDIETPMTDLTPTNIPKVNIIITGYDKSRSDETSTEMTIETTIAMDGENVKYLSEQ